MVAGEIAGAWGNFGGSGALLTNLARFLELSIIQNMEAAPRFERAQSSAWAHLARERGDLQVAVGKRVKINRD